MAKPLDEPIPVGPFLDWCAKREAQIRREFRGDAGLAALPGDDPIKRLLVEIGWDPKHGYRKLYRWRNPRSGPKAGWHSGIVERAVIEDALMNTSVTFTDLYPDVASPLGHPGRLGQGRRMTDAQVLAAHTLYVREKLTIEQVAALLHERFGYASVDSANVCLRHAWRMMGLQRRLCAGSNRRGAQCERPPTGRSAYCVKHGPSRDGGWRMPDELVARARVMHEAGASFRAIAPLLLDETPWRHAGWLAKNLAEVAAREGWHLTKHRDRVAASA